MTDRTTGAVVDLAVLAAVVVTPVGLVAAAVIYWINHVVRLFRQFCEIAFAAPREAYSPVEPPAIAGNGDPGPFRFLIPKLGAVRLTHRLPGMTPHNLRVAALVCLWGPVLGFAVAGTAVRVETPLAGPQTLRVLIAVTSGIVVRHAWEFREFLRSNRPPVKQMRLLSPGLKCLLAAGPVILADIVVTNFAVDAPMVSAFVVITAVVRAVYPPVPDYDSEPVVLSEPDRQPTELFSVDRRATRIAGALDGLVPLVELGVFSLWARVSGWFLVPFVVFIVEVVYDTGLSTALLIGGGGTTVAVGGAFVLSGVAHFELAFGAMEYRLYDAELVAYDTRLDAVQWRTPVASIHDVTVADGVWLSPPGTEAGTVQLDRSGLETTDRPYGFVRQSLACVDDPERVADRLQQATAQTTERVVGE